MIRGGYKILNLNNTPLTDTASTIPGAYNSLEGNYGKAVLVSGAVLIDEPTPEFYAPAVLTEDGYTITTPNGGKITINDDDEVEYTEPATPAAIALHSSTPDSTKVFDITVDDDAEITATEQQ